MRSAYKNLVGNVGRLRCRCKFNTKLDLEEMESENVYWINRAQDKDQWLALVNKVMNFLFPSKVRNFLTI
jgi:hypothetical protein